MSAVWPKPVRPRRRPARRFAASRSTSASTAIRLLLPALPPSIADLPPLVARIALDLVGAAVEPSADRARRSRSAAERLRGPTGVGGAEPRRVSGPRRSGRGVAAVDPNGRRARRGQGGGYQIGAVAAAAPPAVDRYRLSAEARLGAAPRGGSPTRSCSRARCRRRSTSGRRAVTRPGPRRIIDGVAIDGTVVGGDDEAFRAERRAADGDRSSAPIRRGGRARARSPCRQRGRGGVAVLRGADAVARHAVRVTSYTGSPASIRSALAVAARGADLHGGALVTLDERAAGLRLSRGGPMSPRASRTGCCSAPSSFATFLIYGGAARLTRRSTSRSASPRRPRRRCAIR